MKIPEFSKLKKAVNLANCYIISYNTMENRLPKELERKILIFYMHKQGSTEKYKDLDQES